MISMFFSLAFAVPEIRDPVTDLAEVLDAQDEAALDAEIRSIREGSGVHIAVLTQHGVPFGETIESFSLAVATQWGGGDSDRDDGILVVLAVSDRQSRIEVGYGLEGYVTDGEAGAILADAVPHLRAENYAGALRAILEDLGEEVHSLVPGEDPPLHRQAFGGFVRALPHGNTQIAMQALLGGVFVTLGLLAVRRGHPKGISSALPGTGISLGLLGLAVLFEITSLWWLTGATWPLFLGMLSGAIYAIPLGFAYSETDFWRASLAVPLGVGAAWWLAETFGESTPWIVLPIMGVYVVGMLAFWSEPGGGSGSSGSSGGSSTTTSSGSSGSSASGSSSGSSGSSGGDWGGGGGGFGGGGASGSW